MSNKSSNSNNAISKPKKKTNEVYEDGIRYFFEDLENCTLKQYNSYMKKNLNKVQSVDRAQIIDLGNNKKAAFAVYNEEPPVDDTTNGGCGGGGGTIRVPTGTDGNEIVLTPREEALANYIIKNVTESINETLGKRIESLEKDVKAIKECPTIAREINQP